MTDWPVDELEVGSKLLGIARTSLRRAVGLQAGRPPTDEVTNRTGASFVTLRVGGQLRGCIGSVRAYRSLADDVAANAEAAALCDPRFPPVRADEVDQIEIEVSTLSPVEPLEVESESELLASLKRDMDGLILECGSHRGTFLPAVWREIPEPRDFLNRLKLKAGLAADFWSSEMRFWRYSARTYREGDPDMPARSS